MSARTGELLALLTRIHAAAVEMGPDEEIPGSIRGYAELAGDGVLELLRSGQCVVVSRRIVRLLIEELQAQIAGDGFSVAPGWGVGFRGPPKERSDG